MRAVAAPGSHGRSTPPTRQSHQWDASQSRPRRALQEWTCAVKNTGTMPAGSAAFLAFFAIIYMNIAAITFMALALLARGLSPAQTGLVLGVLPVVQVITQPVWGVLADKTGQTKRLLTLACAGLVAASAGLWAAQEFVPLLLAMFGVAVMRAGILPLVTALALTHLGAEDRGFGRIRVWGSGGFSLAGFRVGGEGGPAEPPLEPESTTPHTRHRPQ